MVSKGSRWVLGILFLSLLASCGHRTKLTIEDEVSPSFLITGSGYELFFGLGEVTVEKDRFGRKELPVWSFKSRQRNEHQTWPTIVYGQLPDEFEQTFPKQGSPQPLVEGRVYGAHATIYGTSGDEIWFIVKEGKAFRIAKPE